MAMIMNIHDRVMMKRAKVNGNSSSFTGSSINGLNNSFHISPRKLQHSYDLVKLMERVNIALTYGDHESTE
ncbi:MAG: hypothetical protein HOC20_12625 [Chloroflexi bacterium]|nr:hypothetical protein [Chloroflexota bacterium]